MIIKDNIYKTVFLTTHSIQSHFACRENEKS